MDNDRIVEIGARALCKAAVAPKECPCSRGDFKCADQHPAIMARAALTAFEEAGLVLEQGWQPIETAPKDGRGVLVSRRPKATSASGRYYARRVWGRVCPARWIGNHWRLMLAGQYARDCDLDGWRPLPAPPAAKADPQ